VLSRNPGGIILTKKKDDEVNKMDFNSLVVQFGALVGVAALITAIVNIGKIAGIVKDGTAQTWSAALNIFGLITLFALNIFRPDIDVLALDSNAGQLANVLVVVSAYAVEIGASKLVHNLIKGVPVIGQTYTE